MNIKIGKGGSGSVNSSKGGSDKTNQRKYIDLLPSSSNLTFLFDPIFYKEQIQDSPSIARHPSMNGPDPTHLDEIRNYQFNDIISSTDFNPLTWQLLPNTVQGSTKVEIKNNMFSAVKKYLYYEELNLSGGLYCNGKYTRYSLDINILYGPNNQRIETFGNFYVSFDPDNWGNNPVYYSLDYGLTWINEGSLDDLDVNPPPVGTRYVDNNPEIPFRNHRRTFPSLNSTFGSYGAYPPIDNKKSFLLLKKNDNSTIYSTQSNCTLNFFIKLQRPIEHKNPNTGYIVREKKGIFLTSYAGSAPGGGNIIFGYRSPYYNINGDTTYRLKFEPFSFVFSFGRAYSSFFGRPINFTLMTDYKFKFGEVYFVSVVRTGALPPAVGSNIDIYINGIKQDVAYLPFNPLVFRAKKGSNIPRDNFINYNTKLNSSPLAPGFYKKNGDQYYPLFIPNTETLYGENYNYLLFGKSNLSSTSNTSGYSRQPKRKKHLNNLSLGVISSYNIALSQSEISQIYENFRYRYI